MSTRKTSRKQYFLRPESSENTYSFNSMNAWYRILHDYLKRKLAFGKDRLPAISGVARVTATQTGWKYYSGLWDGDMLQGLLWNVNGIGIDPEIYRAPSWSWASPSWSWASLDHVESSPLSKHGSVAQIPPFHVRLKTTVGFTAEFAECQSTLQKEIYGRIESGHLRIHGQWLVNSSLRERTAPYFNHHNAFLQRSSKYQSEAY
jgi:hypothetical protein